MTFKKLFGYGFLLWVFLAANKVIFLTTLNLDNMAMQLLYGLMVVIFTVAMARRVGVLNYLEAILVTVLWFFLVLFLDFIVTTPIVGIDQYAKWQVWVGYVIMLLSIFLFHKKRHIEIRKEKKAEKKKEG